MSMGGCMGGYSVGTEGQQWEWVGITIWEYTV